jgi:hypothetical protein
MPDFYIDFPKRLSDNFDDEFVSVWNNLTKKIEMFHGSKTWFRYVILVSCFH